MVSKKLSSQSEIYNRHKRLCDLINGIAEMTLLEKKTTNVPGESFYHCTPIGKKNMTG
jgi:hypothetical protein